MGSGIRRTCHKCYSNKYDSKKRVCPVCGWTPETVADKQFIFKDGKVLCKKS